MEVKIKKLHRDAVIPTYAKPGDAGMDITAITRRWDTVEQYFEYGTGLALEIPEGYVGLIFPRSSISDTDLLLCNSVGVLDSGYRGEVKFRFKACPVGTLNIYNIGDRIGQIVILPYPRVTFVSRDGLSTSGRGTNGYGSTGK